MSCLLSLIRRQRNLIDHLIFRGSRLLTSVIGSVCRHQTFLRADWSGRLKVVNLLVCTWGKYMFVFIVSLSRVLLISNDYLKVSFIKGTVSSSAV